MKLNFYNYLYSCVRIKMKNKNKDNKINSFIKTKILKNNEIQLSEEIEEQNNIQVKEEIINNDLPKKYNNSKKNNNIECSSKKKFKDKKLKNKNNLKNKKKSKSEEGNEFNNQDLDLIDSFVVNPSQLSSLPTITKVIEDEKTNEKVFQREMEEYKIAKYFSQTKLIEPKNTNMDLLFLPEEDSILSLCDGKLFSLNINTYKINSIYFSLRYNIINFAYNDKLRQIITLLESSMIAIFDFDTEKIVSQIKIHKAIGKIVKIDPSKNFFAVVTSRNNINIYNIKNLSLECILEDHKHIIYDIIFNPSKEKFELYSCSEDSTVRVWNLLLRKCTNYFYQHGASIRHLQMTNDGNFLIGGSFDNKLYVWRVLASQEKNIKPKIFNLNKSEKQINFECMLYYTKVVPLDDNKKIKPTLLLGDDEGILAEFDLYTGNVMDSFYTNINQPIVQVYFYQNETNKENYLFAFTNEQFLIKIKINILLENISNSLIEGIYPFYCQEILSLKWLNSSCNSFAFSSNDKMLKIYDIENNKINIFEGHTDFIMSITIKNNLIITSSKDNTIRIWSMNSINENKFDSIKCISVLKGHSESVNCSDIYMKRNNYLISGCKDGSIKLWDIKQIKEKIDEGKSGNSDIIEIKESLSSKVAHDDEINAIKFSPNGKTFASASYDKTIKLFEISNNNDFKLIHTFIGHKKGITDISFSPFAKILASCGTDKLIKMWNLVDYTCLNTYEGHLSSVLKIDWIYRGTHLISGGGDGLLKLWNVKTSENILTLDAHDGKIWAFDINKDNNVGSAPLCIISGATDGKIVLWKDNTKEEEININNENLIRIQKEDQLRMRNYSKDYIESMKLSLELNHKKNFIESFDNYLQIRISEEIQKINQDNNILISNYTLPKIKDVDSSNDDLLSIIIQNEKELDKIYLFSSSKINEESMINSYEKIIDIICKEEQLKNIIVSNINKIMDIILENNINVRGCLGAQVLLKIVLKYISPEKFFKKIIREDKDKNKLDEETIEDLLEGGIFSSLGIKGAKALNMGEKKELKMLKKKSKREEETLLQKLEIIEGYSNKHLKRIKKEIVDSQILGYEINKLKAIS